MKEKKIRKFILGIFEKRCKDLVFAEYKLKDYCNKNGIDYRSVITGNYHSHSIADEEAMFRYIRACNSVDTLEEVLRIFYTQMEIRMFKEYVRLAHEKRMGKLFSDNFKITDLDKTADKNPSEDKLSTFYKKCDDKATLYDKISKTVVEACEPTAEDYDSQAKAEAGVSYDPNDLFDSTSQAIYGRRYQESVSKDGVTPGQMNAIYSEIQKACEESAN